MPKGRGSHINDKKRLVDPEEDPSEMTIPICFGDFTTSDAERVKGLWERTWSQDARDKGGGGKGKK